MLKIRPCQGVVIVIFLLLAVSFVYGQLSPEEKAHNRVNLPGGNVYGGIQFTIASKNYKPGEFPVVELKIKNVSDKDINFFFSTCVVEFLHLFVFGEDGKFHKFSGGIHRRPCGPGDTQLLTLKSGEVHTDQVAVMGTSGVKIKYAYTVPDWWGEVAGLGMNYWRGIVYSNSIFLINNSPDVSGNQAE